VFSEFQRCAALGRHKAGLLDFLVHASLEQGVEPGTLFLDLAEIGEFDADADDVGVTAVVGEAEFFRIRGLPDDR
jgi:hypothetical protein